MLVGEGCHSGVLVLKSMPAPFIDGTSRPEELTRTLARHRVGGTRPGTTSPASSQPVGVRLNLYYLDYFTSGMHFAGHYVAVYGYADGTVQGAGVSCNRSEGYRCD